MTITLLNQLRKKYPNIDGKQYADITTYEGNERIYFTLQRLEYTLKEVVLSTEQIKEVASNVFTDIGWEMHEQLGMHKNIIKFYLNLPDDTNGKNKTLFKYQSNYLEQDIEFGELDKYLHITISTGNRGNPALLLKQRNKYSLFIDEIVKETLK
ncbi:MAG: hypothetical protein ACP5N2_03820 [Candidatus Nanoarchaeia archaeon]